MICYPRNYGVYYFLALSWIVALIRIHIIGLSASILSQIRWFGCNSKSRWQALLAISCRSLSIRWSDGLGITSTLSESSRLIIISAGASVRVRLWFFSGRSHTLCWTFWTVCAKRITSRSTTNPIIYKIKNLWWNCFSRTVAIQQVPLISIFANVACTEITVSKKRVVQPCSEKCLLHSFHADWNFDYSFGWLAYANISRSKCFRRLV